MFFNFECVECNFCACLFAKFEIRDFLFAKEFSFRKSWWIHINQLQEYYLSLKNLPPPIKNYDPLNLVQKKTVLIIAFRIALTLVRWLFVSRNGIKYNFCV